MPEIGIRELKNQASEILRAVREDRVEYVVTHRGKPIALIVPFAESPAEFSDSAFWQQMDQLTAEMEAETPPGAPSPLQQLLRDRDSS